MSTILPFVAYLVGGRVRQDGESRVLAFITKLEYDKRDYARRWCAYRRHLQAQRQRALPQAAEPASRSRLVEPLRPQDGDGLPEPPNP